MIEPRLKYASCTGAALTGKPPGQSLRSDQPSAPGMHQVAYWEWNETGDEAHPHVLICVHGLSRQARDFDTLARALAPHMRVICPDMPGRGQSDWLSDPMAYQIPQYAADLVSVLEQLNSQSPVSVLDWVGTSMGGLIGIVVASLPAGVLPTPIRRLVLNDVGPAVEWSAVQRIAAYLGVPALFDSEALGAEALWADSAGFGPHTEKQWADLSQPMFVQTQEGSYRLHYDPAIAEPIRAMTRDTAEQGETVLWQLYDAISAKTLLLRGEQSDLLSITTAQAMASRGPCAKQITFQGVGHAPTLVADQQVQAVCEFLLAAETPHG